MGFSFAAPLAGRDAIAGRTDSFRPDFNPRAPCGARPHDHVVGHHRVIISIHAPLAGCDLHSPAFSVKIGVFQSTHPLRGATAASGSTSRRAGYFNPRTPCGVRPVGHGGLRGRAEFQSTHPLRGATRSFSYPEIIDIFQSTHPLRGATVQRLVAAVTVEFQSTHPLRGATRRPVSSRAWTRNFNPRTPCGVRRFRFWR